MGLFSGVIATVVTQNYLEHYISSLEQGTGWQTQLSQQKSRSVPATYNEAAAAARIALLPSLVSFYNASGSASILPGSEVGVGVVITSDGWVLTTSSAIGTRAFVGTAEYPITDTVRDSLSNATLVKLDAKGLPVIAFGDAKSLETGDLVFAGAGRGAIVSTTLLDGVAWRSTATTLAAEIFSTQFLFSDTFPIAGAPVVNGSGELIAMESIPLSNIESAMRSAIRSGKVVRAAFGAQVIDLSFVHVSAALSRGFTHGAFVTSAAYKSPAAIAGIKIGDVITRVADTTLDRSTNLAQVLATVEPGQHVSVVVDRGGTEMTFEVELGTL